MEVLHIITGLKKGGAETLLFNLCKFDKKHKHTIISLSDIEKSELPFHYPNVSVHSLNFPNGRVKMLGLYKLYKLIKKIKPNVVQTWMIHADLIGGIVARFAGIKNIIWGVHHTVLLRGKVKYSTSLILKFNAFFSNFIPRKIIYCAEKSRIIQESIGYKKSKGIVIHNGYDLNNFIQNDELRREFLIELSASENTFVIGHVGSYDPLKDQNTLIEAFTILHKKHFNFTAALVGKNLDKNNSELVSKIKKNGLCDSVHLLGIRNDIPTIMNGIDIFMLSSLSEAFPNVLNEAMACGTPCISTNAGDASLIVDNTGWIVNSKEPKSLADAVIKAANEKKLNNDKWIHRQKECRQRIAKNFTLQKMVTRYIEVWSIDH
jgi:glycosyltransferase involved in cell wall biosynthesis